MNSCNLKKGDIVDVISPGTACNLAEVSKIKNCLKKSEFLMRIFLEKELTLKKSPSHEFSSFKAELRFMQLENAIKNPESKIIWCTRGGYGCAEILSFLQSLKKPKNKKIFIGFSDVSAINNFLIQEWGWEVISAPMLIQIALNKVSKKSEKAIFDLIIGKTKILKYKLEAVGITPALSGNLAASSVVGGCVSVLSSHFGTKNQLDWQNKILFLEDEGEDGERLDRYFTQLVTIMNETKKYPRAIILGNFLEANPHGTPKAKNIKIAISKFAENISKKVPFFIEKSGCLGHSKNMMPLILGKESTIKDGFLIQEI